MRVLPLLVEVPINLVLHQVTSRHCLSGKTTTITSESHHHLHRILLPSPPSSHPVTITITITFSNLEPNVNESMLESLFASHPGYRRLRISQSSRGGGIIAFIEFDYAHNAQVAMTKMQSYHVPNVTLDGGLRLAHFPSVAFVCTKNWYVVALPTPVSLFSEDSSRKHLTDAFPGL